MHRRQLHPVEVCARRKTLARAAQDHHANGALVGNGVERIGQFGDQLGIERIVHIRPVQRDNRQAFLRRFERDEIIVGIAHGDQSCSGLEATLR